MVVCMGGMCGRSEGGKGCWRSKVVNEDMGGVKVVQCGRSEGSDVWEK